MIEYLRDWSNNPTAGSIEYGTAGEEILGLLEWYICECLYYAPDNRMHEWWSDGLTVLQIEHSGYVFKLLGVTWIDSKGLAPFEIDVTLDPHNDEYFRKSIFRIGVLDKHRDPKICDAQRGAEAMLCNRPRHNQDWAMAVELTPLDDS